MGEFVNAVVGQSGGPTCAINATLAGVINGCLKSGKINNLYSVANSGALRAFVLLYEFGNRFTPSTQSDS